MPGTKFPKRLLEQVANATSLTDDDMIVTAALNRAGHERTPKFWENVPHREKGAALRAIRELQGQEQLGQRGKGEAGA